MGRRKTIFNFEIVAEKEVTYISADDLAYDLEPENPEDIRIQVEKIFLRRLEAAIQDEVNLFIVSTYSG